MSDTATFLAQAIPWPDETQPGYVSVHSPWQRPGTAKPVFPGDAFTDLDSARANVAWRVRKGNNTYVCMSLQRDASSPKQRKGRTYRGAIRKAENALLLKGFWLDADTKNFADEEDLLTQFGIFRRAVGLPVPSFIHFTGGGFHFHWVLPDPITVAVWQPVANALAEACRQHGFKADHQCTVNPAQLMRIPGTENHRYDPPRLVRIIHAEALVELAALEGPLAAYRGAYRPRVSPAATARRWSLPPGSRPAAAFHGVSLGPPLPEGIEGDSPSHEQVADACPWFKDALDTGGARHREPEWFEALKVAYHCRGGAQVAHAVSDRHPDYDVQSTNEKFVTASASAEKYGWPQCRTIQSAGATQCAACPHLAEQKSPLNFVLARPQATTSSAAPGAGAAQPGSGPSPGPIPGTSQSGPYIPFMPEGYRFCSAGFIEHEVPVKEGTEWRRMYPVRVNGFVRQKVNKEIGFGKELLHFQFEDDAGYRDAQIRLKEAHDLRALKAILCDQGMAFKDKEAEHMGRFMASFVQQLRAATHLSVECEPYGWSMKGGVEDAFTFDGTRFNCHGNRQVAPPDINLGNKFKAVGDLAIWKQACKLITDQKRPDLNTLVACSLAAPLVQMTGHNGFVVSAYSTRTGVQKSAAMRVGHAMWGDPNEMAGLDDTNNYLNTRLGMLRHLPMYVDELKFTDELRKAEMLVLGITQGKTKGKLTRDSQTMETRTFNTMMITASNASLAQYISTAAKTTTAGMARIFEFVVAPHTGAGQVDMHVAQALIGNLGQNHGTAGRVYAEFLGQNVDRVRNEVRATCRAISDIVKGTSDERFWVAAIAVIYLGAKYGNELGLTEIDGDQLGRFLLAQFKLQRGESDVSDANIDKAENVEKFVVDFINAHAPQTIKTDAVHIGPGKPLVKPQVLNDINTITGLSRGVCIHAVRDQALLRISRIDFNRWLTRERRGNCYEITKKIRELLPVRETKVSIGIGTPYKRAQETVLEFDVTQMPNINLFI